ncbi:type IV pilin-like G/H family protein [Gloeocapsa sp. PCC 73106]|uniref:type IV pilin-like G/H family protein n=1 Tax=Gloeocapsa sp. PCC 73106 TaxID=102232 RepID=UPI0006979817|nr:type IV pilin-like G/H family protein [Gloeocapsa sp. PCC 73106]
MNIKSKFKTKLLFYLLGKQSTLGFTLLELMIVMIFLSIFAAIALPNLVKQAGKAREVEFKHAIGTVNRAQQAYHWEKGFFVQGTDDADSIRLLNLGFDNSYIDSYNIVANSSEATIAPTNPNYQQDQTRAYSGGAYYDTGSYSVIICQSNEVIDGIDAPLSDSDCGENERLR